MKAIVQVQMYCSECGYALMRKAAPGEDDTKPNFKKVLTCPGQRCKNEGILFKEPVIELQEFEGAPKQD